MNRKDLEVAVLNPPRPYPTTDDLLSMILEELKAVRASLEWQNEDTLIQRALEVDNVDRQKAEWMAMQRQVIDEAREASLEVQRQAYREHEAKHHQATPRAKVEVIPS